MKVGDSVRTAISLPGIPTGTTGTVKEVGRPFLLVSFDDGREGYYPRQQLCSAACGCANGTGIERTIPLGLFDLRVSPGSHCCLLPSTESVALEATARFAAAGLESGETVICGVPNGLRPALLARLRQLGGSVGCEDWRKRLVVVAPCSFYLPASEFTAARQLEKTIGALRAAARSNPQGARAFVHVGRRPDLAGWWQYEEQVTPLLREAGTMALCVYDRAGWGTDCWRRAIELHHYVVRDDHVSTGGLALVQ